MKDNMGELISVIVPVYNVEAYLKKCLDSLREQTYKNLEIILIDDGSTDASGSICDEYVGKDSRFCVIHQENRGVLAARNAGIERAKGSFIGFVDSDDWIARDTYEKLYHRLIAEQGEIIIYQKNLYDEELDSCYAESGILDEGEYQGKKLEKIWENIFFSQDYSQEGISLNLSDKLIKRELILQNYELVDTRLHYFEDIALGLLCMLQADKILISNEAFYYYRQRKNSLCHRVDSLYLEQINIFYRVVYQEVSAHSEEILTRLRAYIAERAIYGINYMMGLNLRQGIPFYLPPFEEISLTDRIALYGAGDIGKLYYRMFQIARKGQVVLWVDRRYEQMRSAGMPVEGVETLKCGNFDKLLIAVKFKNSAEAIKRDLIQMGIPADKIVWKNPTMLIEV